MARLRVVEFRIEPEVREKLAAAKGHMIVANHPSLIDAIFLLGYADQANCVVKSSLWRNPFLCLGVRAAGYIPNRTSERLFSDCEAALRSGQTLIIFPEATRTVAGQPLRLQRGAANIALRADAHLRVVHFECEPPILSKQARWYHVPPDQPCYSMKVGVSLRARDFSRHGEHYGVAARRLTDAIRDELAKDVFSDERPRTGTQATLDRGAQS